MPHRDRVKAILKELSTDFDSERAKTKLSISGEDAKAAIAYLYDHLYGSAVSLVINVDGASRGNPGKAGAGAIVKDTNGEVVKKLRKRLPDCTNNVAEYEALILGLEEAHRLGAKFVSVSADSELLVKQMKGLYKVKSESLAPLYSKAIGLSEGFKKFSIAHVPREKNSEADRLANEAIDNV